MNTSNLALLHDYIKNETIKEVRVEIDLAALRFVMESGVHYLIFINDYGVLDWSIETLIEFSEGVKRAVEGQQRGLTSR